MPHLNSAVLFGAEKVAKTTELTQKNEVTREKFKRFNVNGSISDQGIYFVTESGEKYWISESSRDQVADFKGKEVNLRGRAKLSAKGLVYISVVGHCKEL